jgi:hypothetical protein
LIGFKAYFDDDQAIIDWWESMDEGSRSNAIRDLIHVALGLRPPQRPTAVPDLADLKHDTRWIRQALDDMPSYLEQLLAQAVAAQPANGIAPPQTSAHNTPTLNDAESQRRARKLARVSW